MSSGKRSKWLKSSLEKSKDNDSDRSVINNTARKLSATHLDGKTHKKESKAPKPTLAQTADKHKLYAESVQLPRAECRNLSNIAFRLGSRHGQPPRILREDFCGTGVLCLEWCKQHILNKAYGVDLDRDTIKYATTSIFAGVPEADRVKLVVGNVLSDREKQLKIPKADIIAALNYGCCYFHQRTDLIDYLSKSLSSLRSKGVLVCDLFGASAWHPEKRSKKHAGFTYIFEQSGLNPLTDRINLDLHFHFPADGSTMRKAFSYDFRVWSIADIREAMLEVGFKRVAVYVGDSSKRTRMKDLPGEGSGEEEEESEEGSNEEDGSEGEDDEESEESENEEEVEADEEGLSEYVAVKTGEEFNGMTSWNAYVVGIKGCDTGEEEDEEEEAESLEDEDKDES